ncbi:MAG: hypothetical protein QM755_08580 [Luteolibacter sp.]
MQELPGGSHARRSGQGADQLTLPEGINLAAINSPQLCTVSGSYEAIASYQIDAWKRKASCARRSKTSHAFHSAAMEPIVAPFTADAA